MVELHRDRNFRDVGGLPTRDGGLIKSGVLFRCASPHLFTDDDVGRLRAEVTPQVMIDLRNSAEAERYPAPMDRLGGRLVHLPFPSSSTGAEGRDADLPDLTTAYRFIAELSAPSISALFRTLAEPNNLPAVVFCAAGKDRTGVATALVLGALEVEHSEIAKDYAISGRFDPRTIGDEYAARYDFLPDSYRDSEPETMQQLLDGIAADHGSVRGFVIGAGVEEATLRALKARLVV